MSKQTVSREEYEELLKEVRELREKVDELVVTLKPILYFVEKLPDLMTDLTFFKSLAPLLAISYAIERANPNVLGAAMVTGIEALSKSFEKLAAMDKPPKFSILSLLRDKETKEALGIMIELVKNMAPHLYKGVKEMTSP